MSECSFCGWCEMPERCVWSVICPLCASAPRDHCRVPGTSRIEGLHAERWAAAGLDWRVPLVVVEDDSPKSIPERMLEWEEVEGEQVWTQRRRMEEWEELRRIEEGATT